MNLSQGEAQIGKVIEAEVLNNLQLPYELRQKFTTKMF